MIITMKKKDDMHIIIMLLANLMTMTIITLLVIRMGLMMMMINVFVMAIMPTIIACAPM